MNRDIAYREYNKRNDIHGTVLYPAVMVAPVQKSILLDIIDNDKYTKIIDPFHGSGTSLYEAMEVSENIFLVGCDINPLANLITRVKLQGVSNNIESNINKLALLLKQPFNNYKHSFPNIEKWFYDNIICSLSHIRNCIKEIENDKDRLFFWCMFINIIRKYSNTRSSTYKLHVKELEKLGKTEDNTIKDFIKAIKDNYNKYLKSFNRFVLHKGDIQKVSQDFPNDEFDICITSPPYGDNKTTVPYGQFSSLALYWIDNSDIELEGWELTNYSIIDTMSLGGRIIKNQRSIFVEENYSDVSDSKKKKLVSYFNDYFKILDEMTRITKNYIIMTLGNRTVDGINIDLTNITIRYLKSKGFKNQEILERDLISKRIPSKVSRVNNKAVSSMNKEYVIVMKK